ncbi:hypothetical protein JXA85_08445 [Candidatus Woesearchaeota archaeon]|nr:hypothetical protein [Candidatus Woesearchaeota archaeon]
MENSIQCGTESDIGNHQAFGLVWLICEVDNKSKSIPDWCRNRNPKRMPSVFCLDTVPGTQCPNIRIKTLPYAVIDRYLNRMKKELDNTSMQVSMRQVALEKEINKMKRNEISVPDGYVRDLHIIRNHGIKLRLSKEEKDDLLFKCKQKGFSSASSYIRWYMIANNDIHEDLAEIKRMVKNGRETA